MSFERSGTFYFFTPRAWGPSMSPPLLSYAILELQSGQPLESPCIPGPLNLPFRVAVLLGRAVKLASSFRLFV